MNNPGKKETGPKRVRRPRWSFEETRVLVECKKDAFLSGEEGGQVWKRIASDLSRIQGCKCQRRSNDECRRRWDTLMKVYKHIEDYCVQTGQDHWELDKDELKSMNLATAYRKDWYTIVKEVSSNRKRRHGDHTQVRMPLKRKRIRTSSPVPNCRAGSEDQIANIAPIALPEPLAPRLSRGFLVNTSSAQGALNHYLATQSEGSSHLKVLCASPAAHGRLSDALRPSSSFNASFTSPLATLPNISSSHNEGSGLGGSWLNYLEYADMHELAKLPSGSKSTMPELTAEKICGRVVADSSSSQTQIPAKTQDTGISERQIQEQRSLKCDGFQERPNKARWVGGVSRMMSTATRGDLHQLPRRIASFSFFFFSMSDELIYSP